MTSDPFKRIVDRIPPPRSLFENEPEAVGRPPRRTPGFVPEPPPRRRPPGAIIFVPEVERLAGRIREKRGNSEVIAENARAVRAALKTAGLTDLARTHADAVRDAGDGALAELGDFCSQLHKADPETCRRWKAAMKRELPAETGRLERAIARVDGPEAISTEAERSDNRKNEHEEPKSRRIHPNSPAPESEVATSVDVHKERSEERKERILKDIKWNQRPEAIQTGSVRTYRTEGPVLVGHTSHTFGLDGMEYDIVWWPLDDRGKRMQLLTEPDNLSQRVTSISGINIENRSRGNQHVPPFDNPNGWEFELQIPPQPDRNGTSTGHELKVYLSR